MESQGNEFCMLFTGSREAGAAEGAKIEREAAEGRLHGTAFNKNQVPVIYCYGEAL
jgi:hypothetical protein